MNPCQAQIKIILGKVNQSNNNFFIFLYWQGIFFPNGGVPRYTI